MSVSRVILFISTVPEAIHCKNVMLHLHNNNIQNIEYVRLDTQIARERALNNKNISIKTVPTLAIIYSDGNVDIFNNSKKIINTLNSLHAKMQKNSHKHMETLLPQQPKQKEKIVIDDYEDTEQVEFLTSNVPEPPVETDIEEEEVQVKPKKSKKKKSKKKELEFVDEYTPPPTNGLAVGPQSGKSNKSTMKDIMRQAEDQRKQFEQNVKNDS